MTSSSLGTASLDLAPSKAWRRLVPSWVRSLIWVDAADSYDAFLSYSWKADKSVAPVLQSVIQRFLCPWYKVRAKTVFRDLSCLPAGSSLETQLFERLDRSEHLLVLASPEAANSHGMEMEAEHWFSRSRSGQVLILVTSGDAQTWDEIRDHVLPPAIRANLPTEPLWIPLQHRRADIIASPNSHELRGRLVEDIRQVLLCFYPGRDWGQLRGEERSQRRRALGLMTALTILFLMLAVAAVGFAVYAQRERLLAQSRQLAAQSASLRIQSPALLTRSILLAVESLRINPNLEADQTIRAGVPLLEKPAIRIPYRGNVSHIVPSPTGEFLVTVKYLETHADVWRVSDRKQVASLSHDMTIEDLAFDPTGSLLAVAGLDAKVVVLWNLSTMKEAARLDCGSAVNTVAFSHDGRYLATGQGDHTVRIWEMMREPKVSFRELDVLKHDDEVLGVKFSRDGRYLATSYLNFAVLWKLQPQSNDLKVTFLGYVEAEAAVNSIALSPDNKYLATGICCGRPFRLWDVERRALVTIMPDEGADSVGFSPDGKYVTASSRDDTAGVWQITPGESGSINVEEVSRVPAQSSSVAFTSDGNYLVSQSEDGTTFWQRNPDSITASFSTDTFAKFASSPDGRFLVRANDPFQPVESFDLDTGTSKVLLTLDNTERSLALSRDATHLATQRDDGTVLVRKLANPPLIVATLPPDPADQSNKKDKQDVRSTEFSFDAQSVVLHKSNGTLVFWDLPHERIIRSPLQKDLYSMQLSEDGKHLVTASGAIRGRRSAAEKHVVRIWDVAAGQPTAQVEIAWPQEAKERRLEIAVSPDGRYFAAAREALAQVWDSVTRRELIRVTHEKSIHGMAFSSDSRLLGTASVDGSAKVWNIGNGKDVVRLPHEGEVWEIAFNPDGKHIATASDDRTARVWEYPAGREIARVVHKEMARGVFFSGDGTRVISWSPTSGELKSWVWRAEDVTKAACQRVTRNLTADESREYSLDVRRKTCPNLP